MLHIHYLVELEFTFRHSGSRVRLIFNSGRKLLVANSLTSLLLMDPLGFGLRVHGDGVFSIKW